MMLLPQVKPADGYARYQEIVDGCRASPGYRDINEQLEARKK